jgi:hypothetical protein
MEIASKVHLSFSFPDNRVEGANSQWTQKMLVEDGHIVIMLFWGDKPYPTYTHRILLAEWNKGQKAIGAAPIALKKK